MVKKLKKKESKNLQIPPTLRGHISETVNSWRLKFWQCVQPNIYSSCEILSKLKDPCVSACLGLKKWLLTH